MLPPKGEPGWGGISRGFLSEVRKGAVCELQERAVPWRYSVNHTREALIVTGANKNRNRWHVTILNTGRAMFYSIYPASIQVSGPRQAHKYLLK